MMLMPPPALRRLLRALCALLLALVSLPAQSGIVVDGATTQVRPARPGDRYRGTVAIRNTGKTPAEVKLYQTDYAFWADGRNDYGPPGKAERSNARWLRLNGEQFTVLPGSAVSVDYEVSVPDDPRLAGTYWSLIMVEPLSPREAGNTPRRGETQINQVVRYAVQVISEIGETGKAEIAFRNPRLLHDSGKRLLSVDVENTGERWLRPQLRLELHDPQGRALKKIDGQKLRIYPGTSVRYQLDLSIMPAGAYLAFLVADGGRDDLFGTQFELNIP
jgi:hypothetical protein